MSESSQNNAALVKLILDQCLPNPLLTFFKCSIHQRLGYELKNTMEAFPFNMLQWASLACYVILDTHLEESSL